MMNILKWIVVISVVLGLSFASPVSSDCGSKEVSRGLIKGGIESNENEWPWLASLVRKSENIVKNGGFFCSGTLISLRSVITAAHCVQNKGKGQTRLNPNDFEVHLGRHNLSDSSELNEWARILMPIVIIAMHPDWRPTDSNNARFDADIALLIAGKDFDRSPFIRPICLLNQDVPNVIGTSVGWGYSSDYKIDDTPSQTQVTRVSPEECFLEDYNLAPLSSNRTFCVKGVEVNTGVCSGDSGGGLFAESGNVWFIHGIVSSTLIAKGNHCPTIKHSIYTKLSSFQGWIMEGIEQYYAVQFSLSIEKKVGYEHYHQLILHGGTLWKGAFLSSVGGSANDKVKYLVCEDQNLRYLPNNIGYLFPNLLYLWTNNAQTISIERPNFKNLEKLIELNLNDSLIEEIPFDCFHELKKVEVIGISYNRLKIIHEETFARNPSLREIHLYDNQIESIKSRSFNNKNVEILNLGSNRLASIPHDAFYGMDNLKEVDLDFNKLTAVHSDTFLNNPKLLDLYIQDNQIRILSSGLFKNNKYFRKGVFDNNPIIKIEVAFENPGRYDFGYITCVNKAYEPDDVNELDKMNAELNRLC